MNIINNTIITDNFKSSAIQANTSVHIAELDKTTLENLSNATNIKSDTYLASKTQLDNATGLIEFAKKLLYNDKFREIAVNSDPKLKEAYENFTEAIKVNDSKLAEYIRSVISDSNKFSGELFYALNKLMADTKDLSLKNTIYDFLKIFDYYFSQYENASAVNSALNELLNNLPEDLRNQILTLISNSYDKTLNLILLSLLDTKIPEKEKLKLFISYLLDITDKTSNIKDNEPLDILNNFTQAMIDSSDENIKLLDMVIKTLNNSKLVLDNEIKTLIESLEENLALNNTEKSDKVITGQSLNMQKTNIKLLEDLVQNVARQNSKTLSTGIIYEIELKNSDIIKFLDSLKTSASFDDKSIIINLIDDLGKIKHQNPSELSAIFDRIKNNIINSNSYTKDNKEKLLNFFSKLVDNTVENLIFSDSSKNKCELLLNIYEKNIMPNLLKNSEQNTLSALTHNLLRLKLGTASEFDKQIKTFFNQLNYKQLVNLEESVNMKLALINKLVESKNIGVEMKELLKLLDTGMRYSSNEQNRAAFENTLLSLISKDDLMARYKYFFLPLIYNGQNILSEIFVGLDRVQDQDKKLECFLEDFVFKITMILDIENKGIFNTTLVYSNGNISANIEVPKHLNLSSAKISKDIKNIIAKNKLVAKNVVVS
jgi:hypothetical protein